MIVQSEENELTIEFNESETDVAIRCALSALHDYEPGPKYFSDLSQAIREAKGGKVQMSDGRSKLARLVAVHNGAGKELMSKFFLKINR